jgi:hypothetical protein
MNRFLYAHANPTTLIDPTGHGVDCQMGQTCSDAERASDQQRWQEYLQRRDGNGGGGGGGGGADEPEGPIPTVGSAEWPTQLTLSPSDIDRLTRDQLLEYLNLRDGQCAGKFANFPGCQDYGYAYCRWGYDSQSHCLEYASLKDFGDLDGPFGTFVVAPLAAGAVFVGGLLISSPLLGERASTAAAGLEGVGGFATKADARVFLRGLNLPSAQLDAALRAVSRATASTRIDVASSGSSVTVSLIRPGHDGYQVLVSVIGPRGTDIVVQLAYKATGVLDHVDPKFP